MPPKAASDLGRLSVAVEPRAEEAVVEHLGGLFGMAPTLFHDWETGRTHASVFLPYKKAASPATRRRVARLLDWLRRCGLDPGPGRITVARVKPRDWAESWKRHFPSLVIGARGQLLLQPTWSRRRARAGQTVVLLDPGMSFGTGHHPTTRFCLEQLLAWRLGRGRGGGGMLDVGCGTGVLAIAAAKLGYGPVRALDNDAEAVRVARENCELNGVADRVACRVEDLSRWKLRRAERSDVVCANLTADLLIGRARHLAGRVAPGGLLVLAGILQSEIAGVREAYGRLGFTAWKKRRAGEWASVSFLFELRA